MSQAWVWTWKSKHRAFANSVLNDLILAASELTLALLHRDTSIRVQSTSQKRAWRSDLGKKLPQTTASPSYTTLPAIQQKVTIVSEFSIGLCCLPTVCHGGKRRRWGCEWERSVWAHPSGNRYRPNCSSCLWMWWGSRNLLLAIPSRVWSLLTRPHLREVQSPQQWRPRWMSPTKHAQSLGWCPVPHKGDTVAHTYNSSTWEVEGRGSGVKSSSSATQQIQRQLGLPWEPVSKRKREWPGFRHDLNH